MEIESINRKYVMSRTPKRYEIKRKGLAVVITKLKQEETKVIPEVFAKPISNPNVIKPNYMKPIDARRKLDEMAKNKNIKTEEKKETKINNANPISIPSFSNFKDIKSFVEQQQKENSKKNKQILRNLKDEESKITRDEQEDIDDLVNGNIQKEQKRIDDEYLRILGIKTLSRLFKMVTGVTPNNNLTKFEIRKIILEKYKELPSSKKQLVYEASKLKD